MAKTPEEVEMPPIYGTSGNDIIYEKSTSQSYYGKGGNDVFFAEIR